MKKCPRCNIYYSEEEYEGCPKCGSDLVPYEEPNLDNHAETRVASGDAHSKVEVGNDNTFTGGIHSTDVHTKTNSDNQVHTNSHNTTNNTTIYEAVKSNSERLEEDILRYRLKCKELFVNGLISKEGESQLRALQIRLSLEDELVVSIKDEIQQKSKKRISPTASVISGIHQTKLIIEQNSDTTLRSQLDRLASWMEEYDDDTLKLMYFQLSAILEPERFTNRYEKSSKDDYWEVYWAHIAYILRHNENQANIAHASLGRLQIVYSYPEQNDVILHLAGRLMQNDSIVDIQKERNALTANYSRELQLLLAAIDELLLMDWTKESITIRPTHSFYINTLFTNFVETQKANGKRIRDDIDRISRAEQEKQNEIKRQKAFLLQKYQELEDIEKTCCNLGIPYLTFREWLETDLTFNSAYHESVRYVEKRRSEREDTEAKMRRQKSDFTCRYEQNNCDLFRTCSDMDIDSNTVSMWRKSDMAFDEAIAAIEYENERTRQEAFAKYYELHDCDFRKACADMGISIDVVNNWKKSNRSFDETLTSIKCEYDRALQDSFVRCYALNNCNIQRTCDELNLTKTTINEWRNKYDSFNESLLALERKREDRIAEGIREHRRKAFMKLLPYIIIILLISLIVAAMGIRSSNRKAETRKLDMEKQYTEDIRATYNSKITQFNEHYAHITRNNEGITKLKEAVSVLNEIKKIESEKSTYLLSKESVRLTNDIEQKCEELMHHFNTMRHNDDDFVKRDGEQLYNAVENIKRKL